MNSIDNIAKRIQSLQADEQIIIDTLLERIETGRKQYGPWEVNDGRDYQAEIIEEVIDALHYCAALLVRNRRSSINQLDLGEEHP